MSNISQWSTTAASNNDPAPDGAGEGMAPSGVNDTIRENMAAAARQYIDQKGTITTGGTTTAYTLTTTNAHAALTDIALFAFQVNAANTGAATLAVDGLTAKNMQLNGAALAAGDIRTNEIVLAVYNPDNDVFDIFKSGLNQDAIKADTISEQTSGSGVTIDGVLLKDNGITATGGGSLTGTWSDLGTVTTIDINGGTVDGAVIGGTTPAAGTFTDLTGTLQTAAQPNVTSLGTLTTLTVDNITVNGAAITSDTGAISFDNENLSTTGTLAAGVSTLSAIVLDTGVIKRTADNSSLVIDGGNTGTAGANVVFYGGTHASRANDIQFRSQSTDVIYYDDSASTLSVLDNTIIGSASVTPAGTLHAISASDTIVTIETTNGTADSRINFRTSIGSDLGGIWYKGSNNTMYFRTSNTEAFRLDGSQNATFAADVAVGGFLNFGSATEVTISTGAITVTETTNKVETEGGASTDDLDTINGTSEGDIVILRSGNSARDVVVKDGTGNLRLEGDFTLSHPEDRIMLINDNGTDLHEISRSNNGT